MRRQVFVGMALNLMAAGAAVAQQSALLDDPAVEAAAEAIRSRNIVTVERAVRESKRVCEIRCCRYGLFGLRSKLVRIERDIEVEGTVSEVVSNLDDGVGWSNIGDPHLGFHEAVYSISALPAAAGARGSKINIAAEAVVKDNALVDVEFGDLDRVLVRTPRGSPSATGPRLLIRVEARVRGLDDKVIINVKVQERDAAGVLVNNPARLNAKAQELWNQITTNLSR